ncbi:MAG: TlyA family RNA methyltransferase [Thermotogae bacterium]|nr:TlyA family RNA methyltransferase [Thermotogota bacterium]HOO74424.1 TlyA family RNA methyltransferase [Tepiditoga sp.]
MRIDLYLTENNFVSSRTQARNILKDGFVKVNGKTVNKTSYKVSDKDNIEITNVMKYVSRGAYKLLKAIDVFGINPKNKVCCDIGSSTGGFCQVLLEHSPEKIYAVDVGTNQMSEVIKNNNKIILMENTNARDLILPEKIDIFTCDVSFISVEKIISCFTSNTDENSELMILFKPQFQVGKENIGRNGIVKDKNIHYEYIIKTVDFFEKYGFFIRGFNISPVKGGDGNTEYLMYYTHDNDKVNPEYIKYVVFNCYPEGYYEN